MKISLKLSSLINQEIENTRLTITDALDAKFRADEISHEVWRDLMKTAIGEMGKMKQSIHSKIENYSGKRRNHG